ncbi:hypothetical protein FOB63_001183 [Clavispora lusitaniae]|uniref:uncharacterized protein n=1 Tax=Clavispora lusitaniae TaxID=36911 RepID=UPI00202C6746|nr:hypothetical protein FOB63_001183 [Clavispora lusitaniae]
MLRFVSGKHRCTTISKLLASRSYPSILSKTFHLRQIQTSTLASQHAVSMAHPIEKILLDPVQEDSFIEALRTPSGRKYSPSLYILFSNAIDMASSELSHEAYKLVLKTWETVFSKNFEDLKLQKRLLKLKPKVIHLMMNRGDYASYTRLVRPIYNMKHLGAKSEWADVLMSTLQLSTDALGIVKANHSAIEAFLRSEKYDIDDKRLLIATYVRKCMLHSAQSLNFDLVLSNFISFLGLVGDGNLHLTSSEHLVYESSLRLLALPYEGVSIRTHIENIERIVTQKTGNDKHSLSLFMSSLLASIAKTYPSMAHHYWSFKKDHLSTGLLSYITPEDLLNVMWAYFSEKKYETVLRVYADHPSLQRDDQIIVLLKISDKTKDWRLLQSQFEDMYGRGELPYVAHYVVVMNALASIGATSEVDKLYEQLRKRNLAPTPSIFLALIKSRLNVNDDAGARMWFDTFLQKATSGEFPGESIPKLQAEMFSMNYFKGDVGSAMQAFQEIIRQSESSQVRLIDAKIAGKMIDFASSVYATKELDAILALASRLNIVDDTVYQKAVDALMKFGQFEKAEDLLFMAHVDSVVPFSNSLITKAQIKMYRTWFKSTPDTQLRQLLAQKVTGIIKRIDRGDVSPRNKNQLLVEVIKHFVSLRKLRAARSYLEEAQRTNGLSELHFLPFFKHFSELHTYEGHAQVLELYREMVKSKVPISASSYYYLIKSLLHMDKVNNTSYENSYNLLESVFELYGFSSVDNIAGKKLPVSEIAQNSVLLLKIVSAYAVATALKKDTMDIVVKFLTQIKQKLGSHISFEFRVSILSEMSHIYHAQGDLASAEKMVDNALSELHDIIDTLHLRAVPKLLQLQYRKLVTHKIRLLRATQAGEEKYEQMLEAVCKRNIRLSGPQFSQLTIGSMQKTVTLKKLRHALAVCEKFLVSGNWIEIKINRKIQYIYKLLVVYLRRSLSADSIHQKYKLLNDYYNVRDFTQLEREFARISDPQQTLSSELAEFSRLSPPQTWTLSALLQKTPEFFVPGRQISTKNIIEPSLASVLIRAVEIYCDGDMKKAFGLYDDFPETMEYLLYFGPERARFQHFYSSLDQLAPVSTQEDVKTKRDRAVHALRHLQISTDTV